MFVSSHLGGTMQGQPRPRLLAPPGWFALLAVLAIVTGAVLGLVI